ncbi:hypothetical protein WJX75_008412 [Coccomyxa subellipsoidea]|uniref:UBC core domain-containing protein n=1 Tax=Coccomyxa subellipsoidea TaxID=248742 RepID=A0ABR2YNU6_9CHLO
MAGQAQLPRRIVKETQRLMSEPAPGISASPCEDNLRYFNVIILGPQNTPYEGGSFKLELFLPEDYPMAPPKALLSAPNPDDPLAENVAKHWKDNEQEAVKMAKQWTHSYATDG